MKENIPYSKSFKSRRYSNLLINLKIFPNLHKKKTSTNLNKILSTKINLALVRALVNKGNNAIKS